MEKIFNNSKADVQDNGFLERVMRDVTVITPPSRTTYRAPTLMAAIVAAVAIAMITLTVGTETMNKKYEKLNVFMTRSNISTVVMDE